MAREILGLARCIAVGVLALAVAACGGGGDGGSGTAAESPAAGDYFPLQVGDVWYYDGPAGEVSETRVTGTRVVNGLTVFVTTTTDSTGATEELLDKSSAGVMALAAAGADALDLAFARIPVLQLPLVAGESRRPLDQSVVDMGDVDGDGRADSVVLTVEVTLLGFETLTTPAGTWNKVAHLRTVITEVVSFSASGRTGSLAGTVNDWYAPDVGLVRSEYTLVSDVGSSSGQQTLRAFRAGALRSENVAPSVLTRHPAKGSVAQDMALSVGFSEPMDRHALPAHALQVTGPDGQTLPGTLSWQDERTLAFVPKGVLASGVYVVSLGSALQDLVGNAVAGELSWTFSLDRQGPMVVSMSPAQGAVEVALNSTIRIEFDEAPDPASISVATVALFSPSGQLPATLTLDGRTLTVTPTQPLQRAGHYWVSLSGVRDGLGNASFPGDVLRFRADGGRFAPALPLGGLARMSGPMLAADVNADQRSDVLVEGSSVDMPGKSRIFIYRQLADGTLAQPEALPSQTDCFVYGARQGDLTLDGRADVVVLHQCGMEVLQQTADGRMLTSAALEVLPYGVSTMHMLRGAGRPAIVALPVKASGPTFVGAPQVWRQGADGSFGAPTTVPTSLPELYSLSVADINGDGLDDLVLRGLLSSGAAHGFELILQRADGSFGPSREVPVENCGGTSGTATGDVNGDGRTDLLVIGNACNSPRVDVLLQDASGGFAAAAPLDSLPNPRDLAVADVDGDGRMDIVASHDSYGVGVYLQRADGSMAPQERYESPGHGMGLTIADVTGDGLVDILSGGYLLRQKPTPAGASAVSPGRRGAGVLKLLPGVKPAMSRPAG